MHASENLRSNVERTVLSRWRNSSWGGSGLPSFNFLRHPARQSLEEAMARRGQVGLLWVSLDGYSMFQKLYGSDLGDSIMARLYAKLRELARTTLGAPDFLTVDRVDQASYVITFCRPGLSLESLMDLAMAVRLKLRNNINAEVVQLTGQQLGLEVGYALARAGEKKDLEHLFYNALCDARQVADGTLDYSRLSLMSEFRDLLDEPRLWTVYQPIVDLNSGRTLAWESLARGPRDSNFSSPCLMFDFAEEVGCIFNLERVCREQAFRGLGPLEPDQKLFLNIHPQTLGDPDFKSGETRRLLEAHGLKPHNVVFEITERHSIKDFTLFHRTLEHYRNQGYLVAIDDVGTGYSGLSRLARVRPDYLKVDMSLVRGVDTNPVQRALLETLVTFADKIGCAIVAEGIETETELSSLMSMGVHYGQGFYLARPAAPKPKPDLGIPFRRALQEEGGSEWKCSIPVSELAEPAPQLGPEAKVKEVKNILDGGPISGVVVVDQHRPVGLVMSHNMDRQLGTYYGTALYYERSVSRLMDTHPLIVEGQTPVEQVARLAMNRERFKIYDHIIVTQNGYLLGIVSVQKMLDALAAVQLEMAKGANPLTGLPGNVALEQEIESRIAHGEAVSFIYVDLDHFKVYNDTYGFESGDRMILMISRVLLWAARRHGGPEAYTGHVGGDDFVVILPPERADRVCRGVVRCFGRLVKGCYRPEDRERGFVLGKGRNGHAGRFPLVSVSLAIVDCVGPCDLAAVGQRAAEVKQYAKSLPGNVFVRDRRRPLGEPEPEPAVQVCGLEEEALAVG